MILVRVMNKLEMSNLFQVLYSLWGHFNSTMGCVSCFKTLKWHVGFYIAHASIAKRYTSSHRCHSDWIEFYISHKFLVIAKPNLIFHIKNSGLPSHITTKCFPSATGLLKNSPTSDRALRWDRIFLYNNFTLIISMIVYYDLGWPNQQPALKIVSHTFRLFISQFILSFKYWKSRLILALAIQSSMVLCQISIFQSICLLVC